MKLNKIMMAGLALCAGLAFTSCKVDALDPNPMAGTDVKLVSFGPAMLERMDTMQIYGVKLDKASKVIFVNSEVEKANFVSHTADVIEVQIPDESRPGKIGLLVGSDTVWSKTLMTFAEPISITGVTPAKGILPGSEITIKGEYVYNIATIEFPVGQIVTAADFVKCERRELVVKVPMGAVAGAVTLSDGANWVEKVDLDILGATYESMSADSLEYGEELTIKGANLQLVEKVAFPGVSEVPFTLVDNNTIKVTVHEDAMPGALTLTQISLVNLTTGELKLPVIGYTDVTPVTDVKANETVITITGSTLDHVKTIIVGGDVEVTNFNVNADATEITFIAPEGMKNGKIVLRQNANISLETANVKIWKPASGGEEVLWDGDAELNWNTPVTIANSDIVANLGKTLNIAYYGVPAADGYHMIRMINNSWGWNPDGVAEWNHNLDENEVDVWEVVITQELIDNLAGGDLCLTGYGTHVTKVYFVISSVQDVFWEGDEELNWNTPVTVANSDIVANLGKTLYIAYYGVPAADGYHMIRMINNSWGWNPDGVAEWNLNMGEEDVDVWEKEITQELIDNLAGGDLCLTGYGVHVTKVYVEVPVSTAEVVWEGDEELNWNTPVTVVNSDIADNIGKTLAIYYYGVPAADGYHMIRMINNSWGWNPDGIADWNLNMGEEDVDVWEKEITQELVDNLAGGDLCLTGYGVHVTKVEIQ